MKKAATLPLFLLVLLLTFACKKDSDSPKPGLSMKIDGTSWNATLFSATYFESGNTIMIVAGTGTETLGLNLVANTTGTYNFAAGNDNLSGSYASMSGDDYSTFLEDNPVGQIIITEFDKTNKTISGTFYFDGYNGTVKKAFTDGVFTKVSYVLQ
jgi:hypothetical protein